MNGPDETTRLGTELEIVADFDLRLLLEHFGSRVEVLRDSSEGATRTVWLDLTLENDTVDEAVAHYVAIVDEMPAAVRNLWNACADRCLNTGVQSGRHPHATPLELRAGTVAGAARIGVRLVFTIYAVE
jgi:hypothetical protein